MGNIFHFFLEENEKVVPGHLCVSVLYICQNTRRMYSYLFDTKYKYM